MTPLNRLKIKAVKIATAKKLEKNPFCVFCGMKATTAHHFIRQSRSNFLRVDMDNLIPICAKGHMKLHSGYEQIMTGELIKKYGINWFDRLQQDSNVTIKDNKTYWKSIIEK